MSKKTGILFLYFCSACSQNLSQRGNPLILDKKTLYLSENIPLRFENSKPQGLAVKGAHLESPPNSKPLGFESVLSGTGRALFNQPLFGLYSKELYFIKARFFNENSSLTLHSHFTGFAKQDGIQLSFTRKKDSLIIQVYTPGHPVQELYAKDNYFFQNQNLEIYAQMQNGTKDFVHIKVWDLYTNPTGYLKTPSATLTKQNLIADSRGLIFYSRGRGMLWGVDLDKILRLFIFRESVSQ